MEKSKFTNSIELIGEKNAVIFGLTCVSRSVKYYSDFEKEIKDEPDSFFEKMKAGTSTILKLIEIVGSNSASSKSAASFEELIPEIDALIPDSENISTEFSSLAQCCAISMYYVVKFCASHDWTLLEHCSNKMYEIIDLDPSNEDLTDSEIQSKIDHESETQKGLIKLISELESEWTSNIIDLLNQLMAKIGSPAI